MKARYLAAITLSILVMIGSIAEEMSFRGIIILLKSLIIPFSFNIYLGTSVLIHLLAYLLLAILWSAVFKENKFNNLIKGAFISSLIGFLIEIVQQPIPYRMFDMFDILVNLLGAFFIFPLYYIFYPAIKNMFIRNI